MLSLVLQFAVLAAAATTTPNASIISLVLPVDLSPQGAPVVPSGVDPKVPITGSVIATESSTTTYQLGCQNDGKCFLDNVPQPLTLTAGPTFYQHGYGVRVSGFGTQTYTEAINQHCEFTDSAALTCTASSIGPVWVLHYTNAFDPPTSGASTQTHISTESDPVQTLTGSQLTTVGITIVSGYSKLNTAPSATTTPSTMSTTPSTMSTTSSTTSIPNPASTSTTSTTSTSNVAAAPTAIRVGAMGSWAAAVGVGIGVFF
ncbi:MAG: hypothetical protein M1820_000784 [Bogoriella megaspora]|nr:MAG: hypothetical protein M1820_000784 [Bogoriella megaspora]